MTAFSTAWMLAGVWGSGFVFGAVVASGRRRPRGNGNCEPMPPAGPPVRFDEGQTQRGNGSGGPTTPKPPIKPRPSGGRMVDQFGMTTCTPPPREP